MEITDFPFPSCLFPPPNKKTIFLIISLPVWAVFVFWLISFSFCLMHIFCCFSRYKFWSHPEDCEVVLSPEAVLKNVNDLSYSRHCNKIQKWFKIKEVKETWGKKKGWGWGWTGQVKHKSSVTAKKYFLPESLTFLSSFNMNQHEPLSFLLPPPLQLVVQINNTHREKIQF